MQTQEEHEECETTLSVSEAAEQTVENETKKKKVLVSAFIILEKQIK